MTFLEALEAYHQGKKIRREKWDGGYFSKESFKLAESNPALRKMTFGFMEVRDILADDWVVDE